MKIGEKYEDFVAKRSESAASINELIPFEWFDFHHVCRGMKFENVSQLLEILRPQLEEYGSSVQVNGRWERRQKGILRTNCMDCLDRTNVCQSSFAKYVLEAQLRELGFDMSAQLDQQTAWFNTLWADNGDAVSNQYASTAAMKGDYTRFKKRDYRGTLNDIGLSLTRFYNGMVNDYFSQAAIDFVLGNVTSMVFDEFEANMMTKDPAISMSRMRDQAIEECQKRVVADDNEEFIGGWVLLSPHDPDTLKSEPFQEVVLLLTDSALADLSHVTSIKAGVYITSTITALHMDEQRNFGFVVTYLPGKEDFIRTNTRTPSTLGGTPIASTGADTNVTSQPSNASQSALDMAPPSIAALTSSAVALPSSLAELLSGKPRSQQQRLMAFKAPYTTSKPATANDDNTSGVLSEAQRTDAICAEIERLVTLHTPREAGEAPKALVQHADVISLEEAKKSTGLFDTLGYAIKKMVWAS
ncbi:Phosphatidylinositide phosphatase SAC2 [Ceratocystis platani]|uniref:Phosphatidylinositide phosphatase SAC2 n=1 Tax=Ceratocystis fimbriata f. sp. platani TaxID=88771 RepID=A0A0F8AZF1_CERFI|nr:Phosphatidylinositide phosphatase SAC2 [Ceratocystis platani]